MSGQLQPLPYGPWFEEQDTPRVIGIDYGTGFSITVGVRFRMGQGVHVGADGNIYPVLTDMETYIGEMEPM